MRPAKIAIKKVGNNDKLTKACARMVQKHSWGMDYPEKAVDEFKQAELILIAAHNKKMVGCAAVHRMASPDKIDNGKLWFADVVVLPQYRQKGILNKLYAETLNYLKLRREEVFTCTGNLLMVAFFMKHGWEYYRLAKDAAGDPCLVFRLPISTNNALGQA